MSQKTRVLLSVLTCVGLFAASALVTSALIAQRRHQVLPLEQKGRETSQQPQLQTLQETGQETEYSDELPAQLKTGDRYGLLLCGIDHTRSLADVIIYAQLDLTNRRVQVLQIPRDLFVGTQYTTGKINSACLNFSTDDPAKRIKSIVSSQLGLQVDGSAVITLAGVRALVDSVGGVTVNLERAIEFLPGKTISTGFQTLSGEQSEWLLRYRKGYEMGDLDRLKVQKQFMLSAMQSVKNIGKFKALKIAAQNFGHVKTTIPFSEIRSLIELSMGLSSDSITIQTLPVYGVTYQGYSVLCINRFKLADMLNAGVRAGNPVDPWSLQLAYPPEGTEAASSKTQGQSDSLFDFSWDFKDSESDNNGNDAEGVVIRKDD
ncbi:MAG TPA: LCP family protein [Clostridia bacterium]|nr:LCP family protein [Clostridia bacterium]